MVINEAEMIQRLLPDAKVVHDPSFESGIIKLQRNESLAKDEIVSLRKFKRESVQKEVMQYETLADAVRQETDLTEKRIEGEYLDTKFVEATSNVCERFFSRAKLVITDLRNGLTPESLEMILYLKINREFWSTADVFRANKGKKREREDELLTPTRSIS